MSLIQDATQAIVELHKLTVGLKNSQAPNPMLILGLQSELVTFYRLVGEEMASKFGAKERLYIKRKIEQAKSYQHNRVELKKNASDSTEEALLAAGEDFIREMDSAEEYERYRVFLKSIQNAIDYSRSVVSFFKTSETH